MLLKPLGMTDCQRAAQIVAVNALWRDRYHYPEDRAARDLLYAVSHGDFVLGAFSPELVGFAWVLPTGAFGRSPYLRLLAVAPEAQGGGTGRALLEACEARFSEASWFFLLVSDFNERAQRFYGACGYRQVGVLPEFVLAGVAEQVWVKRLLPSR